jgi:hypothetical protein
MTPMVETLSRLHRYAADADGLGCPVAAQLIRRASWSLKDRDLEAVGRADDVDVTVFDDGVIIVARWRGDVTEIRLIADSI